MANSTEDRDARFGERMIELKVRFWTDRIAEGKERIRIVPPSSHTEKGGEISGQRTN